MTLARPKSATFTTGGVSFVSSTFSGFKSRCTTPMLWMYCIPVNARDATWAHATHYQRFADLVRDVLSLDFDCGGCQERG